MENAQQTSQQLGQQGDDRKPGAGKPTIEHLVIRRSAIFQRIQLLGVEVLFLLAFFFLAALVFGGAPGGGFAGTFLRSPGVGTS